MVLEKIFEGHGGHLGPDQHHIIIYKFYILKTLKNATDKSVVFLIHNKVTHFVYVLTGFPFAWEC